MLRHLKYLHARKATSPWVNQAKTYFLDAASSHWRSAGLLYYYSFLNLAKAFLVANRVSTYKKLDSTSVYHGLSAELQAPRLITDFELRIYPPIARGRDNIFSLLYQTVTKTSWPFRKEETIRIADVAGYCQDISIELKSLSGVKNEMMKAQSLLRFVGDEVWFEMIVPRSVATTVRRNVAWPLDEVQPSSFTPLDRSDWLLSLHRTSQFLTSVVCLRGPKAKKEDRGTIIREAKKHFEMHAFPTVFESEEWRFVPKIELNGKKMFWHPLLSDYLFAFALSNILRYQPQILAPDSPNDFLAEAWCRQSAVSTLRQFLMLFTKPPLIVNCY
jgi:hypothetical protein